MEGGKVPESVAGVKKILYPYYTLDAEFRLSMVEKTGWFSKEEIVKTASGGVSIDAVDGALIDVIMRDNGDGDSGIWFISYRYSYLKDLDDDGLYLFRVAPDKFEKRSLSALGWSAARINKAINGLWNNDVIKMIDPRPVTFELVQEFPWYPLGLGSLKNQGEERLTSRKSTVNLGIGQERAIKTLEHYWPDCDVKSVTLVYYPYYAVTYRRDDDSTVTRFVDGISGERQEYLDDTILTLAN